MQYCVVILDGASGWPVEELGGRTTLQAASTPHLDALAARGTVGVARTVPEGMEPSSSVACTSILGYDPAANRVGRGAIEAASLGVELAEDEVALRMNLVAIEDGVMESYCGGRIASPEARAIVLELSDALAGPDVRFYPGVGYRHILVVKGRPELLEVAFTPPHDISGRPVEGQLPRGDGSGFLVELMERARGVLERLAVNRDRRAEGETVVTDIWPFWPGERPRGLRSFADSYGVRAAMSSAVDLLNGLAVLTGIERLSIPGVTDGHDNDYAAQAEGSLLALGSGRADLVIVHVESPDEAGHAGDVATKVAAIEAIDREVVGRAAAVQPELRLLCMPDHPTPVALKTHVAEAVPFMLWGPGLPRTSALAFDEAEAVASGLVVEGRELMGRLLAP